MENSTLTGKCLCRLTEFVMEAEPLTLYACHCTDCQTASGASFTLIMQVKADCIRVTDDRPTHCQERMRANGKVKKIIRCPECLTALWGFYDDKSRPMSLYAGTLDCSSELVPIGHIWTCSAQPWVTIPKNVLSFNKQPPSMDVFYKAWSETQVS